MRFHQRPGLVKASLSIPASAAQTTVKWLVVDTGNWLSGREVLLPLSALGRPDAESRRFPVKLTMQQVKDSPDINTDMAVSRQMETDVYNYYGWSPYWSGGPFPISNAMATPLVAPLSSSGPRPDDSGDDCCHREGDAAAAALPNVADPNGLTAQRRH